MSVRSGEASLIWAVAGFALYRTPARLRTAVMRSGWDPIANDPVSAEPATVRDAEELRTRGFAAVLLGTAEYPSGLAASKSPPPVLFCLGATHLLGRKGIGVCGSRRASEAGLVAAAQVADVASDLGLVLVAGNAKGVDRTAQQRAGELGAALIAVLPEGSLAARIDPVEEDDLSNQLIASEFPPHQPWTVGAAMERNKTIVGLSEALVVIEPGATGGTYEAALAGLRAGSVVILFSSGGVETEGSEPLRRRGAKVAETADALRDLLEHEARGRQASLWPSD